MQHGKSCRFVLAAVAALLLGPMPTWAQERPLKKINWGQTALSAAMWIPWIAKEAKIYEKNGLDVEIVLLAALDRARRRS
jgi:ABC-type nitrate/sulfonate/bicarbonate transport system substrate-binding protein